MVNKKIFAVLNLADFKNYVTKYFLPIFLLDLLILFVFLFAFTNKWVKILGITLFFLVIIFVFVYPIILLDNQTRDIEQNLHLFITYAGALSTVNLERKELFMNLAEKRRYKEIAKIFEKILYLVESIKIDFATSAYNMAKMVNTKHFSKFLERLGIALSFNSNIKKFLLDEQKVLMDSYQVVYEEGLERIRLIQEMFVSLILSFAFLMATVLVIPFMVGIDSTLLLKFGIIGIIFVDSALLVFSKYFLISDKLYHNLGYDDGRRRVLIVFLISLVLVVVLIPIIYFLSLPIMLKIAIVATPLVITGIYSNYEEKKVLERDNLFTSFIRSFGDVHKSKGGTLTSTLETLLPHNFGILNELIVRVYKRLKITRDKFNSWFFFYKESGSYLISEFLDIFVSVVYRGGSSEVAGEIVSDNMTRILGLRDKKKEFVGTLKGSVYGTYFGLAITVYIAILISILLYKIFVDMTKGISGMAKEMVGSIFPTGFKNNFSQTSVYLAIILTIHALISSYLLKEVDGGNPFSMFTDFVILLWLGAIIEILLTLLFKGMFSKFFGV